MYYEALHCASRHFHSDHPHTHNSTSSSSSSSNTQEGRSLVCAVSSACSVAAAAPVCGQQCHMAVAHYHPVVLLPSQCLSDQLPSCVVACSALSAHCAHPAVIAAAAVIVCVHTSSIMPVQRAVHRQRGSDG
eukprot:1998-Heterococcus_DN1.PRE.3